MPGPLRIGGVPYSVGEALLVGLDQRPGVVLRREAPSQLIEDLRAGDLDAALASSIEAFRQPGYAILPDLGIACEGPVRSVRLFLRTAPADVRTLGLDRSSRTSVALTRILLERRFGARIDQSFEIRPTREPDAVDADAVLLIGDAGLAAAPGRRQVLDLGEEWHRWQGLPFVFAVWLVAGAADPGRSERLARLAIELRLAWDRGKQSGIDDGTGGRIQYELGPRHREGLRRFKLEAAALDLCDASIEPAAV